MRHEELGDDQDSGPHVLDTVQNDYLYKLKNVNYVSIFCNIPIHSWHNLKSTGLETIQ